MDSREKPKSTDLTSESSNLNYHTLVSVLVCRYDNYLTCHTHVEAVGEGMACINNPRRRLRSVSENGLL